MQEAVAVEVKEQHLQEQEGQEGVVLVVVPQQPQELPILVAAAAVAQLVAQADLVLLLSNINVHLVNSHQHLMLP
jgi:hypothetical protein